MSDLQVLIDSPIGAVFFVSGSISVLVLFFIFILKKGSDIHSILGYIFFFGLAFSNYAAAISYYYGYLPFAAVSIAIPVSTISIIIGLASIIPEKKSEFRIHVHIVAMCTSTVSLFVGTLINWYHFNISSLTIFNWNDFNHLLILSLPVLIVGALSIFYFFTKSKALFSAIQQRKEVRVIADKKTENKAAGARSFTLLRKNELNSPDQNEEGSTAKQ